MSLDAYLIIISLSVKHYIVLSNLSISQLKCFLNVVQHDLSIIIPIDY